MTSMHQTREGSCPRATGAPSVDPTRASGRRHDEPASSQERFPLVRSPSSDVTIWPLGATWIEAENAYNYWLYAQPAEGVAPLLFEEPLVASLRYRVLPRSEVVLLGGERRT
jgi:hypothetical protein